MKLGLIIAPTLKSPSERVLLQLYTSWAKNKNHPLKYKFWPSKKTIAERTGYGEDTINEANNLFKAMGILRWQRGYGNQHKSKSNCYEFLPDAMVALAEKIELSKSVITVSTGVTEEPVTTDLTPSLPRICASAIADFDSGTTDGTVPNLKRKNSKNIKLENTELEKPGGQFSGEIEGLDPKPTTQKTEDRQVADDVPDSTESRLRCSAPNEQFNAELARCREDVNRPSLYLYRIFGQIKGGKMLIPFLREIDKTRTPEAEAASEALIAEEMAGAITVTA